MIDGFRQTKTTNTQIIFFCVCNIIMPFESTPAATTTDIRDSSYARTRATILNSWNFKPSSHLTTEFRRTTNMNQNNYVPDSSLYTKFNRQKVVVR